MTSQILKTLVAVHTHTHTHTSTFYGISSAAVIELDKKSLLEIGFVEVEKKYIKYKNIKDRLCSKIVCLFFVEKEVIDTG